MNRYCYSALLLLTTLAARAQSPSIDRTDMPTVSTAAPIDSLRQSTASLPLAANLPPLTRRGANQTWNYAALVPTAQTVDRFISVAATGAITYQFYFGATGGVNRATVASPEPLPAGAGGVLPITDPYQFYNAAAADYRSVGFGGTLGGLQVPVAYRSQAEQDVIYRFPLSFASLPDSSRSFFETPAAAATAGWGTLTTPFGTFNTVRVVSKLIDHDSIAIGGQPGAGFDLPLTREYKWLARGQHVPLLTITTQQVGANEVITGVQYRDRYRRIVTANAPAALATVAAYPNPLGGADLRLTGLPGTAALVQATDLAGRRLFEQVIPAGRTEATVPAAAFGAFRGVVLLRIQTSQGVAVRRVVRE
jgi:hypothetical protein